MKKLLFLPFLLLASCSAAPVELDLPQEIEPVSGTLESVTVVQEPEQLKDYFYTLDSAYLPSAHYYFEGRTEEDITLFDEGNYYMELTDDVTMALFLTDEDPYLAVSYIEYVPEFYFLKFENGVWIDETEFFIPDSVLDGNYILEIPRYGVTMKVYDGSRSILDLVWNGEKFEDVVGGTFTVNNINGASLTFPDTWDGIEALADFSGFGYEDDNPVPAVGGRTVNFGFTPDGSKYDMIFEVMRIGVENIGHEAIPYEAILLGQTDCYAYYGIVKNEIWDVQFIFDTFEINDYSCSE